MSGGHSRFGVNVLCSFSDCTFRLCLQKTKRHLIQRIENLDGKVDDVREMAKLIKDDVLS